MHIDQETRNKMREKRYESQPTAIGDIIEYRVQDPFAYKRSSRPRSTIDEGLVKRMSITDKPPVPKCEEPSTKKSDENEESSTVEELPIKIEDVQTNNWAHMDRIEFDKLAWMMKEDRTKINELNNSSNQARFDLQGKLLVPSKDCNPSEIPTHLGLHHHGDEPESAGYTIEELMCYLKSTYERQRVLAMNVLGNIVTWAHTSFYDNIFDMNIASMIINDAILSVRINLDSPNETTVINSLRCLHAFICNTNLDEVILDRAFTLMNESPSRNQWLQPRCWLAKDQDLLPPVSVGFFSDQISDVDCVKKDPIAALVERTELITRLRYLLDIKPSKIFDIDHSIHECIFDILIRIARHSPKMCSYLSGYPHLLQAIEDSFLPWSITTAILEEQKPSVKALKFIRVLATSDLERQKGPLKKQISVASQINTASHALTWQLPSIAQKLLSYIFIEPVDDNEVTNKHCLRVSIEALRCWSVFLQLESTKNEMTSYFSGITGIIKNRLDCVAKLDAMPRGKEGKTNLYDWQFAAALINIISDFTKNLPKSSMMFQADISFAVFKWTQQIIDMNMIPNISVSLAITSGIDFLVQNSLDTSNLQDVFLKNITKGVNTVGSCLIKSITRECLHRSPIIMSEAYSGCLRDPGNLPSFGCVIFNRTTTQTIKVNPFLGEDSPFLLFKSIIDALDVIKCKPAILKDLFKDIAFHEYLTQLRKLDGATVTLDRELKIRLFEQLELLTLSKALICICNHYLTVDDTKEIQLINEYSDHKLKIKPSNHLQCYDNLFTMAMSCIYLLNTRSEGAIVLRKKLLSNVILNPEFIMRMAKEKKPDCKEIDKMFFHLDNAQRIAPHFDTINFIYDRCEFSDKLWAFEPLLDCYNRRENKNFNDSKRGARVEGQSLKVIDENEVMIMDTSKEENIVVEVLNLINVICLRSKSYTNLVFKNNLEDCLCMIGTVFLSDGLFLDQSVSFALKSVIVTLLTECLDPNDDANMPFQDPARMLKGVKLTVYDFFVKLVEQYEGASYGDAAFSNFLMLFLTPKSHSSHKRYLLSEKAITCINQFRIGREELWIPERILFSEKEKEEEILGMYRRIEPLLRFSCNSTAMEIFVKHQLS